MLCSYKLLGHTLVPPIAMACFWHKILSFIPHYLTHAWGMVALGAWVGIGDWLLLTVLCGNAIIRSAKPRTSTGGGSMIAMAKICAALYAVNVVMFIVAYIAYPRLNRR